MSPSARLLGALLFLLPAVVAAQSPRVEYVWSGALQPTSIRIVAGLSGPSDSVRVALSGGGFADPYYSSYQAVGKGSRAAAFSIDALEPDSTYRYAVEVEGRLDTLKVGTFHTPPDGPFSFEIAVGGCAVTGSDRPVFDVIRRQDPLFFMHVGDMHYSNLDTPDPEAYREAWRKVLASPSQAALYRSTPLAYMWDDHDFGPNNSDRRARGREAAREAYQDIIPHYPLVAGSGNVPIFQSFEIGRVRFILTDLRSSRLPSRPWSPSPPSMMGARQKDWFKQELLRSKDEGDLIVWVSSVPWIYRANPKSDSWGGYAAEREEIANFLKEHEIDDILILAGDAHMVAMDDGTNSDYATGGGAPIAVLQSAPLDQAGSRKGGPYSEGMFPGPTVFPPHGGQFTMMKVQDDGGSALCVEWNSYRTRWDRPSSTRLVEMSKCYDLGPYSATATAPPPTSSDGQ